MSRVLEKYNHLDLCAQSKRDISGPNDEIFTTLWYSKIDEKKDLDHLNDTEKIRNYQKRISMFTNYDYDWFKPELYALPEIQFMKHLNFAIKICGYAKITYERYCCICSREYLLHKKAFITLNSNVFCVFTIPKNMCDCHDNLRALYKSDKSKIAPIYGSKNQTISCCCEIYDKIENMIDDGTDHYLFSFNNPFSREEHILFGNNYFLSTFKAKVQNMDSSKLPTYLNYARDNNNSTPISKYIYDRLNIDQKGESRYFQELCIFGHFSTFRAYIEDNLNQLKKESTYLLQDAFYQLQLLECARDASNTSSNLQTNGADSKAGKYSMLLPKMGIYTKCKLYLFIVSIIIGIFAWLSLVPR